MYLRWKCRNYPPFTLVLLGAADWTCSYLALFPDLFSHFARSRHSCFLPCPTQSYHQHFLWNLDHDHDLQPRTLPPMWVLVRNTRVTFSSTCYLMCCLPLIIAVATEYQNPKDAAPGNCSRAAKKGATVSNMNHETSMERWSYFGILANNYFSFKFSK